MQNDLKKIEDGKLPQKCLKWKTTSKNLKMEDSFKKIVKGRRPQKILKWKTTSKIFKRENGNGP